MVRVGTGRLKGDNVVVRGGTGWLKGDKLRWS